MTGLLKKYLNKLLLSELINPDKVVFMGRDDQLYVLGTMEGPLRQTMEALFDLLRVNSLLWAEPAMPWYRCLQMVLSRCHEPLTEVVPQDCETRTFFHHFPVVDRPEPLALAEALAEAKAAIVLQPLGIISKATVSPEQAFVAFSSACFSLSVKALYDLLVQCSQKGPLTGNALEEFIQFWQYFKCLQEPEIHLPWPEDITEAKEALITVGRAMVRSGLVDSYFGNLSIRLGNTLIISQTAASLDELEDALEELPLGGGSTVALVASSEMPTHTRVYQSTEHRVILHGHPRFSVVMSMFCERPCELFGQCHIRCPEERFLCGAPVVPGEIGTGRHSILNTVPRALRTSDATVVTSHGVFTAHPRQITQALKRMVEIEQCAKLRYYKTITGRDIEEP